MRMCECVDDENGMDYNIIYKLCVRVLWCREGKFFPGYTHSQRGYKNGL